MGMARYFLVAVFLFTGGCSSLTVLETWHNQSGPERRYRKLMILGTAAARRIALM